MDIKPEELYRLKDRILVDIRSPSEYEEFHIPGAVNLPLFGDEEKSLIGLVYKHRGLEGAKEIGYQIAQQKLQWLLKAFKELKGKHSKVVVYCWRGGLRSQELCKFLSSMGVEVFRLEGGYRAYRKFILEDMERLLEGKRFLVLTGKTGVGKSRLLRRLREEGYPVLDLEMLAKDRGSVFGKVGIGERISQKLFDSVLYEELRRMDSSLILLEDESRLIGNVHIPAPLWHKKEHGIYVELEASLQRRLRNILEDYTCFEGWQEEAKIALHKIRKYLGEERYKKAINLLEEGKAEELALLLMTDYYDRTYKLQKRASYKLDCSDLEHCLESLKNLYTQLLKERVAP